MIRWSRSSDRTGERKRHVVIPFGAMIVGLVLAVLMPNPALTMACPCVGGFGFSSACALVGACTVLWLGHDASLERLPEAPLRGRQPTRA